MGDDPGRNDLDAEWLEKDWDHALDVADEAVSAVGRSKALSASEVSAGAGQIRAQRKWLRRFSPSLHKLFPRRR
jgi:hypothetical protein